MESDPLESVEVEDSQNQDNKEPIISATAFVAIALLILLAFTAGKMSAKHDSGEDKQ